jgi:hypothetical protein
MLRCRTTSSLPRTVISICDTSRPSSRNVNTFANAFTVMCMFCVCVCVCVLCVCVYVCVCVCVCVYVYMFVFVCLYVCVERE